MNNTKKLMLESLLGIAKAALKWSVPATLLWLLWIFLTGDNVTVGFVGFGFSMFYCTVFLTYVAMLCALSLYFKWCRWESNRKGEKS